jgi:hypothetical protein
LAKGEGPDFGQFLHDLLRKTDHRTEINPLNPQLNTGSHFTCLPQTGEIFLLPSILFHGLPFITSFICLTRSFQQQSPASFLPMRLTSFLWLDWRM